MNCEEAKALLMDFDQLDEARQAALENHTRTCASCAAERDALRYMTAYTHALPSVDVLAQEPAKSNRAGALRLEPEADVVPMFRVANRLSPWLAAASLVLAAFFVYEHLPTDGQSTIVPERGATLDTSMYKQKLNQIRETPRYRANVACRSPYRKPEQITQCVRQKYSSL